MRINIDGTDLDDSLRYVYDGNLFTGELVELDQNGVVIALKTVVEGIVHGKEQSWYPDGTLEMDTDVVDSIAVGVSRHWHSNGQLSEEREFNEAGDLIGHRQWSENGELTSSETWPPSV